MSPRRFAFVLAIVAGLVVVACGRQVTPNPPGLGPGGALPGYVAIHFDVSAPFNFSNYRYMVVFNTTGSGVTPSTDTIQTNWAGYAFAAVALGNGVASSAEAVQFVQSKNPHVPPNWLTLGTTPQTFNFNLNSNGSGTEFSILAKKSIFVNHLPSPAPSPTASPSEIWTFNAFTIQNSPQGTWYFYDSLGPGGPLDPQFVSPQLNMSTCFDNTYYAIDTQVPDPAAQIVSVELSNNPAPPASPCPPS